MKRYCPKCGSYSVFTFYKKLTQFAVCRNCWNKTPADQFRTDYGVDVGRWGGGDSPEESKCA